MQSGNPFLRCTVLIVSLSLFGLIGAGRGADKPTLKDAFALEEALQEAIRKAERSVVCILTSRQVESGRALGDPDTVPESYGSGVVIGVDEQKHGLILTNFHVVQNAAHIFVRFPGGKGSYVQKEKNVTGDGRCDLAVLRLDEVIPVQPITLGDSEKVRKGQMVLSIANPFAAGFHDGSPSASWGIISNIRRRAPRKGPMLEQDRATINLHQYGTLLQTDARLNLGCSGGALIDLKGELIGLTSAQAALNGSETAGGFAIPMTANLRKIVDVLKEGRRVDYGFLGVTFGNAVVREEGVRITEVIPGSPAARAGLPNGSLIKAINGMEVRDTDDLILAIGTSLAGSRADLKVQGNAQPIAVTLTKFDYPGPVLAANKPAFARGLRVDYTSVLMQRHRGREIVNGVYVSEVQTGSRAEAEQLQDAVITQVNGVAVNSPADFYREAARKPGPLDLTVVGRPKTVTLE
jgi:S1-C subfamily serine protease